MTYVSKKSSSNFFNYSRDSTDWRDIDMKIPRLCLKGSMSSYDLSKNSNVGAALYSSTNYDSSIGLAVTNSTNFTNRETSLLESRNPTSSSQENNSAAIENQCSDKDPNGNYSDKINNFLKRTNSSISFKSPEMTSSEKLIADFSSTRTTDFGSSLKLKTTKEDYIDDGARKGLKECCFSQMYNRNSNTLNTLSKVRIQIKNMSFFLYKAFTYINIKIFFLYIYSLSFRGVLWTFIKRIKALLKTPFKNK